MDIKRTPANAMYRKAKRFSAALSDVRRLFTMLVLMNLCALTLLGGTNKGQLLAILLPINDHKFSTAWAGTNGVGGQNRSKGKPLGDHYLLLVNTAIARLMDSGKMLQFNESSYDGLAVAFWHAYDTSPVPSVKEMDAKIADWKKLTKKDIWPWVYINRMVGVDAREKNSYTNDPYFHHIQGADLDDNAGARKDFLEDWKNALQVAKDSHSPGIVCDLEFYNYHKEYDIGELAQQSEKKPQDVAALLKDLGARMADIAAERFPDATLWFLFTGFGYPAFKTIENQPYYPSPTYIAMGLLDEIQKKNYRLKVISGGEGSLAYCHSSVEQFREAIEKRAAKFAPQLSKYAGILELSGTMTLWSEPSAKKGFLSEGDCGTATAATVEDLEPYVELLLKSFRYNWIYGSADGGYRAFDPQSAPRFDAVISKARSRVIANSAH